MTRTLNGNDVRFEAQPVKMAENYALCLVNLKKAVQSIALPTMGKILNSTLDDVFECEKVIIYCKVLN